jgi:hypothetical protein
MHSLNKSDNVTNKKHWIHTPNRKKNFKSHSQPISQMQILSQSHFLVLHIQGVHSMEFSDLSTPVCLKENNLVHKRL